eukprot:4273005-Pyramimonas_sp.AAC.1
MDPSDAGCAGIFSRWTNRTQDARVYSHDGPIGRRMRAPAARRLWRWGPWRGLDQRWSPRWHACGPQGVWPRA